DVGKVRAGLGKLVDDEDLRRYSLYAAACLTLPSRVELAGVTCHFDSPLRESMAARSPKRDFLAVTDLTRDEIQRLFDLAGRMKAGSYRDTPLAGKTLAMLFAKSSTRTRVSFEVGAYQLGGQALFLSARDIQIGRGEPIPDTARVLSRYVDGIMIRT